MMNSIKGPPGGLQDTASGTQCCVQRVGIRQTDAGNISALLRCGVKRIFISAWVSENAELRLGNCSSYFVCVTKAQKWSCPGGWSQPILDHLQA